jgi:PAS domain S-box-containing protein
MVRDSGSPNSGGDAETELDYLKVNFDESPNGVMIVDPSDFRLLKVNRKALEIFKIEQGDFEEKTLADFQLSAERDALKVIVEKALDDGFVESEWIARDMFGNRTEFIVSINKTVLKNSPILIIRLNDISRSRPALKDLLRSEAQFRSLVENSPDLIIELDLDGKILYCNRVLIGTKNEHAVGTNFLDYIPRIHHASVRRALNRSFTRKKNTSYEQSVVTSGGMRWLATRVLPLLKNDKVNSFLLIGSDITANRAAEEALRQSEERYRTLVENAPVPIFISRHGVLQYANPTAVKVLGFGNAEELVGRSVKGMLTPEAWTRVQEGMKSEYAIGQKALLQEYQAIRPDGEVVDLELMAITFMYEGEPARLVVANDVTEQKRMLQALKESEKKYRYLTENMRDAVWMMDMNWKHLYVSPSIERIRGFAPEEVFNLPIEQSLSPESLQNAAKLLKWGLATGGLDENGQPLQVTFEQEEFCKDGSTVWTEVRAQLVFDEDGKPAGMMGVTRDISDRKRAEEALKASEQRYRTLVDNAPLPILVHRNNRLVFANRKALEIGGFPEFEDVKGMNVLTFVHPDDREEVDKIIRRQTENPGMPMQAEFRAYVGDGETFRVEATSLGVTFGGEQCLMVILRDISGGKRPDGSPSQQG